MNRFAIAAVLAVSMLSIPAIGAPCRDAKGKFTKCTPKAPAKAGRCKGANGKFAKCGTPGAKPV